MEGRKKHIAVVAGGDSGEKVISYGSAAQAAGALDRNKYIPHIVYVEGHCWETEAEDGRRVPVDRNDFSYDSGPRGKIRFDYALIMIHGTPGENGLLQSYFELVGVPYSSCGPLCSAVTFDKATCKRVLTDTGVDMARDVLVRSGEAFCVEEVVKALGLPVFVKPSRSGSSLGISRVTRPEDLIPAVNKALEESEDVLIEECIAGTEVSCGVVETDGVPVMLPVTEIVSENEYFDYRAKYEGASREITPARIEEAVRERLEAAALRIYGRLRCRGVVRIDFIVRGGVPYFIEVNTVPGMSAGSIVPKQVQALGLGLGEFFDRIINETINTD